MVLSPAAAGNAAEPVNMVVNQTEAARKVRESALAVVFDCLE